MTGTGTVIVENGGGGGVNLLVVIGVSAAGLVLLGGLVFFFVRRSRQRMEADVTNLLRQYVPLEVDPKVAQAMIAAKSQPLSAMAGDVDAPRNGPSGGGPQEKRQLLSARDEAPPVPTSGAAPVPSASEPINDL